MPTIRKTVIKLVVLSDQHSDPACWSLEDIAHGIETGPLLGQWDVESTSTVPGDQVEAECVALGNDGSFFEDDDDE